MMNSTGLTRCGDNLLDIGFAGTIFWRVENCEENDLVHLFERSSADESITCSKTATN